ncbi:MAG: 4-alpha-glucanotransferase, partial [Gaiellales bacterium]
MTETDDACRRSGVLLHVTSIPGPDGLGDLGVAARDFITWLQRAGQGLWQTLPLHPPANEAMSPYDAASAFAGDPLLISLDDLTELGLLDRDDVTRSREQHAAYGRDDAMIAGRSGGFDPITHALAWKLPMIHRAAEALQQLPASHELPQQLAAFCEREAEWLLDHVAFTMLREQNPGLPRAQWPVEDRVRTQPVDRELAFAHLESAVQFLFDVQLRALHTYAGAHGVWLMGDAPIYVGEDSADVWGNPELFLLDEAHLPLVRTGAPPDAMDPDGQ